MKNFKKTQTPSTWLCRKKFSKTFFSLKTADEWNAMRSEDYRDTFTIKETDNFFQRMCCNTHKKHNEKEPALFKE